MEFAIYEKYPYKLEKNCLEGKLWLDCRMKKR